MGIQEVRSAFLTAGDGKLRCTDCKLSVIQDGNNSQRLVINGFDMNGQTFELDSGAFDPKTNPAQIAAKMAAEVLSKGPNFRKPPRQAAGQHH